LSYFLGGCSTVEHPLFFEYLLFKSFGIESLKGISIEKQKPQIVLTENLTLSFVIYQLIRVNFVYIPQLNLLY